LAADAEGADAGGAGGGKAAKDRPKRFGFF